MPFRSQLVHFPLSWTFSANEELYWMGRQTGRCTNQLFYLVTGCSSWNHFTWPPSHAAQTLWSHTCQVSQREDIHQDLHYLSIYLSASAANPLCPAILRNPQFSGEKEYLIFPNLRLQWWSTFVFARRNVGRCPADQVIRFNSKNKHRLINIHAFLL